MPRQALIVLGATAALAATAPPAQAVIVPQKGMAGVRIDMTASQVRDVLGRPDSVMTPRGIPFPGPHRVMRYGAISISLIGTERQGRVNAISTNGRGQRTSAGVGVGSPEADVARLVRGARCRTEFGFRHCTVGAQLPGRIVTDFIIGRTGRVTRVVVGRVLD